jgi:hypothetical protein
VRIEMGEKGQEKVIGDEVRGGGWLTTGDKLLIFMSECEGRVWNSRMRFCELEGSMGGGGGR